MNIAGRAMNAAFRAAFYRGCTPAGAKRCCCALFPNMFAVAAMVAVASVCSGFDVVKVGLDLDRAFAPVGKRRTPALPLFDEMVVADLTGDGKKEIVVPGSDARLRLLRLDFSSRRPKLVHWTTVNVHAEGDQPLGTCYLATAKLRGDRRESLVLALPRGIFSLQVGGDPPQPQFSLLCGRTFFDPGRVGMPTVRLDFVADLDGDGMAEIWMPQIDGMSFWRRKDDGKSWERIQVPQVPLTVNQRLSVVTRGASTALPSDRPAGFFYAFYYPSFRLADLDGDGRSELIVESSETGKEGRVARVECYTLRDPSHFSTRPVQVRQATVGEGRDLFLDLNGDGFLDLLRIRSSLNIVRPHTTIDLYVSPPQQEYVFERPTRRYRTSDPIGMVLFGDWNGDGFADLAFSQFDYVFGSTEDLIDLMLGREVTIRLRFVHGTSDGFPDKPDSDVKLRIRNRCFMYSTFPPLSMEGDYDGDGTADLLVRSRLDRCEIRLTDRRTGTISQRVAKSFRVPPAASCAIADLDGDGRSDIIAADPESPSIQLFLSRP